MKKLDKQKRSEIFATVFLIVILALAGLGVTKCVRSCTEPDPFENDEFYNQSIGRQLMMEKNGMYKEAEQEKEMRRAYMRRRTEEIEREKQLEKEAKKAARRNKNKKGTSTE
jgi:hypothetical protein